MPEDPTGDILDDSLLLDAPRGLLDMMASLLAGHSLQGTVTGTFSPEGHFNPWEFAVTNRKSQRVSDAMETLSAAQDVFAALKPLAPHGTALTVSTGMIMLSSRFPSHPDGAVLRVLGARVRPGGRTNAPLVPAVLGDLAASLPMGSDVVVWASSASRHAKMEFMARYPGIETLVGSDPIEPQPPVPYELHLLRFATIALLMEKHADIKDIAWWAV